MQDKNDPLLNDIDLSIEEKLNINDDKTNDVNLEEDIKNIDELSNIENLNNETNISEETKKNKISIKKIISISTVIIILILWSVYWYNVYNNIKQKEANKNIETEQNDSQEETNTNSWEVSENINLSNTWSNEDLVNKNPKTEKIVEDELLSAWELDINYNYDIKWNYKLEKDWVTKEVWNLDISNLEIISLDEWLKQRINLWNLKLDYKNLEDRSKNISIEDWKVDIIWNDEKTFIYLSWWIIDILQDILFIDTEEITKINESWTYAMIDNSKALKEMFWDSWNDIINSLIIAFWTNNPIAYLEKDWTYDKIISLLKSDDLVNMIFEEWETESDKINLNIKKEICNYINTKIYTYPEFKKTESMNLQESSKENCYASIEELNNKIYTFWEIYKSWDIENWDFNLYASLWKYINIDLKYEKHNIKEWSIKSEDKDYKLEMSWDSENITSSNFKIDKDISWIKISWEIIKWNWELKINWKYNWELNINWTIKVSSYKIDDFNIKASIDSWIYLIQLEAIWNQEKWNIQLIIDPKNWDFQNYWWTQSYYFEYNNWEYKLDIINDLVTISWYYKKDKSHLKVILKLWFFWEQDEAVFNIYNNKWKIYWDISEGKKWDKYKISWTYENTNNFDIKLINEESKEESFIIKGIKENNKTTYNYSYSKDWVKITSDIEIEKYVWSWKHLSPWNYEEIWTMMPWSIMIPNLKEFEKYNLDENTLPIILWLYFWLNSSIYVNNSFIYGWWIDYNNELYYDGMNYSMEMNSENIINF